MHFGNHHVPGCHFLPDEAAVECLERGQPRFLIGQGKAPFQARSGSEDRINREEC